MKIFTSSRTHARKSILDSSSFVSNTFIAANHLAAFVLWWTHCISWNRSKHVIKKRTGQERHAFLCIVKSKSWYLPYADFYSHNFASKIDHIGKWCDKFFSRSLLSLHLHCWSIDSRSFIDSFSQNHIHTDLHNFLLKYACIKSRCFHWCQVLFYVHVHLLRWVRWVRACVRVCVCALSMLFHQNFSKLLRLNANDTNRKCVCVHVASDTLWFDLILQRFDVCSLVFSGLS